jgi:nitric oxide reductase NorD protein
VGQSPDDRLYRAARPARRELAIAILLDTSGSTKAQVSDGRSILELEKIAVLMAMEALDALGDRFAAFAFAGKTAENVAMLPIRRFDDHGLDGARRALGALEAGGFTRLGASIRFATHELARQSAGQRLLLILSDGRPNDVDRYQGPYGVEDSRQAIMEARASGVFPFCITVDRDASEYLPRIFGAAGHTILQRAEQLPTALLGAVRALIRRP